MVEELLAVVRTLREAQEGAVENETLRRWLAWAEAQPPSPERERALAWVFLARAEALLAQGRVREAWGPMLAAYSYARTARESEVFLRATEGLEKLAAAREPRPGRGKRRRSR